MLFGKKSLLLFVFIFPFLSVQADCFEQIQLLRVNYPDEKSINEEHEKADARNLKKYVVTSTVVAVSLVSLYLMYQLREAVYEHDKERAQKASSLEAFKEDLKKEGIFLIRKSDLTSNFVPENASKVGAVVPEVNLQGWASWIMDSSKSVGLNTAKFFADSTLLLASGTVLKFAYDYAANKISQTYADETVLWYAHEKTKMPHIFNDLKLYATDYDLYASLLQIELLSQDAQLQFKAFVKDLLGAAQNHMHNEIFNDSSYFEYLINEMKKKYVKKGQELEKLSEYVVPAVAKQKRALAQDHVTMLFANDMNRRIDIAMMCDALAKDMQKLASFVMLRGGLRHKVRVFDMVDACNKFLEQMQMLLNSTPEQLQELSKADSGMFTQIYEYEHLFGEQINFLHRYCKLGN